MPGLKKKIIGVETGDKRKAWTSDVETQKLYHTTRWRKAREWFLMNNYECVKCREYGKYTPATVVDHIKPVTEGGEFWDEDNWQPMCKFCHNAKSAREMHNRKKLQKKMNRKF